MATSANSDVENITLFHTRSFTAHPNYASLRSIRGEAMKNITALVLLAFLLAIPVTAQKGNAVEYDKEVQLENLNISLNLVKSFPNGNIIKICWPEEVVSISSKTVSVDGKTVNELLRKNNILPDIEAFGVVYALNPDIKKLSQLEVTQIKVPSIQRGETLKQLFADGFQVLLTSDKGLKKQFSDEVTRLNRFAKPVSSLEANKFFDSGAKAQMQNEFNSISSILRGINTRIVQRAGRHIPTEVLEQLVVELQSLNSNIGSAFSSKSGISRVELDQTMAVKKDLEIKVKAFTETAAGTAPDRWPEMEVMVRTLRQGQEIPNLRIYYVSEANKEKPEKARSFGILSSPSIRRLPEADYCFWAAIDPNRIAVSNIQCEKIRVSQGTIEVQLTILH